MHAVAAAGRPMRWDFSGEWCCARTIERDQPGDVLNIRSSAAIIRA